MRRSLMTTLSDVAKEAGVAAMTVSVVLNGSRSGTRVSDATRLRIQEAALRLNYRPNAVARGLSRRRMDTLGVVSVIDGGEVNYYFLEVLSGILEGARSHGQNTTVFSVPNWDEDKARFLKFFDGRVDGIIVIAPWFSTEFADWVARHTALALIHPNEAPRASPYLVVDEEGGVYEVTKHLIEQGHRDIVHVAGPIQLFGGRARYGGFRRAMAEAGLPVGDGQVYPGWFAVEAGRRNMRLILSNLASRPLPTAIVCASDAVAYGCMEVLSEAGIGVPGDVSLVGFDDTIHARAVQPPLTTLRQPFRQMGRRSVDLILDQVHERLGTSGREREFTPEPAPSGTRIGNGERFDVEFVPRASVAAPRDGESDAARRGE